MEDFFTNLVNLLGVLTGIVLAFLNAKACRTLMGSFFKKTYYILFVASTLLALSFVVEFSELVGVSSETGENWHHILLLISEILFAVFALRFPAEVSNLLGEQNKPKPSN